MGDLSEYFFANLVFINESCLFVSIILVLGRPLYLLLCPQVIIQRGDDLYQVNDVGKPFMFKIFF